VSLRTTFDIFKVVKRLVVFFGGGEGGRRALCTWVLKENVRNKLMIFDRKIMRKIFGPTRTADGYWRIKTNQEINDILKGQNIFGFI